eukprot:3949811-Pyramimonas_sp.AAC.1
MVVQDEGGDRVEAEVRGKVLQRANGHAHGEPGAARQEVEPRRRRGRVWQNASDVRLDERVAVTDGMAERELDTVLLDLGGDGALALEVG